MSEPRIVPTREGYVLVREDGSVLAQGNILDCRNALAAWLRGRETERRHARDAALKRAVGAA